MLDVSLLQEVAAKEAAFYAGLTRQRQEEAAAKRKKGTGTMTMRERQVPSNPRDSLAESRSFSSLQTSTLQKSYQECMQQAHFFGDSFW
jgi:hypothetical protein